MKQSQKEVRDHKIEAKGIPFSQFVKNSAASKNKQKHQAFGMKFTGRRFRHDNVVVISFRK